MVCVIFNLALNRLHPRNKHGDEESFHKRKINCERARASNRAGEQVIEGALVLSRYHQSKQDKRHGARVAVANHLF